MLHWFFSFLYLLPLSEATSTNTTTTACPSCDATACNYRSVQSLLASCGLTLLICVWHAIHPSVPLPHYNWFHRVVYRFCLMLIAFFTPEIMVAVAVDEWRKVRQIQKHVQDRGYGWWTMTHSHFLINGGFVLCDDTGLEEIDVDDLLSLMDAGDIVNPMITKDDIKDRSTSDGLGKMILVFQLSWFTTQIIVRLVNHLTVTLVELDTVCMALLTVPLIFFWWSKPCCPGRPHFFYKRDSGSDADIQKMLKERAKSETLDDLTIRTNRSRWELVAPAEFDAESLAAFIPLLLTWSLFGALHAAAWNYEFPTETEKTLWRVSSLVLAASPAIFAVMLVITAVANDNDDILSISIFLISILIDAIVPVLGVISRVLLVGLTLASLRSLPSSAHEIISWTTYIPHL